jgi:hypothetical protein
MIMNTQLPPNTQLPGSAENGRDNETGGKRAIEVGFPIVEINRLAVPESSTTCHWLISSISRLVSRKRENRWCRGLRDLLVCVASLERRFGICEISEPTGKNQSSEF